MSQKSDQLVTGKLQTWITEQRCHRKVSSIQTIMTCRNDLANSHDKSATNPFTSF